MQFSDIVIILLLLIAIILWFIDINKSCPVVVQSSPQIIYRFKPDLDLQFDSSNFPTTVYTKMFSGPNTYMGGYQLDSGKSGAESVLNQNNKGGKISAKVI